LAVRAGPDRACSKFTTIRNTPRHRAGREAAEEDNENGVGGSLEQRIEDMSSALAPVLFPMVESLGAFDAGAIAGFAASAESV